MAELKSCPVCGAKAFLEREVVDGFDMGFGVGCPRYCIGDGLHGIETSDAHYERGYAAHCFMTKRAAAKWWNRRAGDG